MRMITSVMVLTFAFEDALISAAHLAGALWKQLRMHKVSFRCNCLCERQGLKGLLYNGFKNHWTSQFFWPGKCMVKVVKGCLYSLDWTTGLDYWTGLLDWTTGLDYWTQKLPTKSRFLHSYNHQKLLLVLS